MIRFHREGKSILIIASVIIILISAGAILLFKPLTYLIIQFFLLIVLILISRFFRSPTRSIKLKENAVFAPADGKIVAIEKVKETEYFKDERVQISIFMSIHNVHINWYPVSGKIKYYKYHPGKYLIARHPKSSSLNEHSSTVISSGKTEIMVRQIAGYVARRIVCYAAKDKVVETTQELGFIKFGSRLDLFLPVNAKILVDLGEKTRGGITEIASF